MSATAEPAANIPLGTVLDQLATQVTVHAIDEVWIFPTRRSGSTESHLMIISTRAHHDHHLRRIFAAQRIVRRDEKGTNPHDILTEYGSAPADRVRHLVEGVVNRLRPHQDAEPPHVHKINGDDAAWSDLRRSLDPPVDDD